MTTRQANRRRRTLGGQTIIIAMIILGVLLLIGFVFLGIVSRNVRNTSQAQRRSEAREIAEAGLTFAHNQMLTTGQGADWRPSPTPITETTPDETRDPDILYLRPASGPSVPQDKGGPDGLGPFTRIEFPNGRSLVRVLYAPSDANVFSANPSGPLRNPGKARYYTIIEAVGRPGRVISNDPTTLASAQPVRYRNFPDVATLQSAIGRMRQNDVQLSPRSSKAIAFASIGVIEHAVFFTNKDKVSRAAEIGVDNQMNSVYRGVSVARGEDLLTGTAVVTPLARIFGTSEELFEIGTTTPTPAPVGFGANIHSNADLRVHGDVYAKTNGFLGDAITIAGTILGADNKSRLNIEINKTDASGIWQIPTLVQLMNGGNPSLNSRDTTFSTINGLVRDGVVQTDALGYPRGTGYKAPPSMEATDPDTGLNRYISMTRETGVLTATGFTGRFGYGQGVYVNNFNDRQVRFDEQGREQVATAESQVYDWLNPNNGLAGSGWEGPFYRPRGAYVLLHTDGFTIIRDARGPDNQKWWRGPDGGDPRNRLGQPEQRHDVRYRIGYGTPPDATSPPTLRIVNTFTPDPVDPTKAIDIEGTLTPQDFDAGQPFNGVLYFEGNVRIRGTIPTDQQLLLVSNATIYIEGSITKGVNDGTSTLNRPSKSMLGLMARDYVAINTTQFFGATPGQDLEEADDRQSALAYNPLRSRQDLLNFMFEQVLDPTTNPDDPTTWEPYSINYREWNGPGVDNGPPVSSRLLLTHSSDDGPAPGAFFQMDVNEALDPQPPVGPNNAPYNDWDYLFPMFANNAATQPYLDNGTAPGSMIPDYGLGIEAWQRYPRFESITFPLIDNTFGWDPNTQLLTNPGGPGTNGSYGLLTNAENFIALWTGTSNTGLASNDYMLARAAITPHDVRIEAMMFAEEGSFFVIPGPPFNPNPNDRYEVFEATVNANGGFGSASAVQTAVLERLENFGTYPETPFYGEPLDVRITIVGAITENMPQPMSVQARWLERWGWIPRQVGCLYDTSGATPRPVLIPKAHVPDGYDIRPNEPNADLFVPNLLITYDPVLATGQTLGFDPAGQAIREDKYGRRLPPIPRLPVSPALSYYGEVNG